MAVKMDPVIIRRKLTEVACAIAEMEREGACPETIQIERRKQMVLKKWLEQAEEKPE